MERLTFRGQTFAGGSSLLTATGAETVHDTTVLLNFCINGIAYQKSGTNADQTTPTTDYNTGAAFLPITASHSCVFVWAYNSSGTAKVMQGPIVDWDGVAFKQNPSFPSIPDDVCPFAYQIVKGASTVVGNWDFGTDNWNDTGITSSIKNVMVLPDRPQAA
jgi:hypothetical protein